MPATCSRCGKTFRFAASIEKYHGWCANRGAAKIGRAHV